MCYLIVTRLQISECCSSPILLKPFSWFHQNGSRLLDINETEVISGRATATPGRQGWLLWIFFIHLYISMTTTASLLTSHWGPDLLVPHLISYMYCSIVVVTNVSAIAILLVVGLKKATYERNFSRVKFRCMGNNLYFYVASGACISPRSLTVISVKALFERTTFTSIASILLCEKQTRRFF